MGSLVIASDVLQRVQVILQDVGAVRWPLVELATWLNDAQRAIAELYPASTATTVSLVLAEGTQQTLPEQYASLIRAICNLTGPDMDHLVCGPVVTTIAREILDANNPRWHDPTRTPQQQIVRHIILDPTEPRTFYVYPGNDGTGIIRAVVALIPDDMTLAPGADPMDMDSYATIELPFQNNYLTPLVDFVLFRAFSKDMQAENAMQRATAHQALFTQAIQSRMQAAAQYNVNTTNSPR
jgi:hypothetical protein